MIKMMRLSQVARKLNIGKNTIIDFLASKGYDVEDNPNFKINSEQLTLLSKEFADSALDKEEASGLTIGAKHNENVVIDNIEEEEASPKEPDEEEFLIKNVSYEKKGEPEQDDVIKTDSPKLKGIKVVGKIDLDKKPGDSTPKKEETPEQKVEEVKETTIKTETAPVVEQEKETRKEEKPVEPKPVEPAVEPTITKTPVKEEVKAETKEEVKVPEEKKTQEVAPKVEEVKPPKAPVVESTPEAEVEAPTELITAKAETLQGLKVLGKIALPDKPKKKQKAVPVASSDDKDKKKKKRPRKRIRKEGEESTPRTDNTNTSQPPKTRDSKVVRKGPPDRTSKRKRGRAQKEELSEKDIQEQIKATLAKLSGSKSSSVSRSKYRREKRSAVAEELEAKLMQQQEDSKIIKANEFISANDLASMMNVNVNEVIATCLSMGMFVSINQRLDAESITIIADEFGYSVEFAEDESNLDVEAQVDTEDDLMNRAPIVTIMGHVDHGKTSLLDYIRSAKVTEQEAGGITQHIGAYDVTTESGKRIAFLDTPGHEAFTAMRARGAKLTDIVVIVVAADDSVMPQTKEAINHAQVAGVPIIIAINKIDKPNANPEKIKEELANQHILVEDWGGKYQSQEISAKTGQGVEELLEKVLLEAELLELKANPNKPAVGTVVEAELDKGRGYVATILIQAGTLKIGDILLAGAHHGRVKAMFDHRGKKMDQAIPSTPVLVLGLDGAPQAGDSVNVMATEREARDIAVKRTQLLREQNLRTKKHITLDEIGRRLAIGSFKELNVIVKGDVDGSVEALSDSLLKLSTAEVQINIIAKAVGQISESDVLLASASDAIIIGFQVRPSANARRLAEQEEIEIRHYSVIYDAINEVKDAMEGMLAPQFEEIIVGNAEVREVFKISKVGTVAGCMVTDGVIKRNNQVRLVRDGIVVYTGDLDAVKRFKDDVNEVKNGFECGLSIKNFNDLKIGDVFESFENREVKRKL